MSVDDIRKQIDALDDELVRLLNERTRRVLEIGRLKQAAAAEAYVPSREKAVLDRVCAGNPGPLTRESLQAIYREIMSASLALERRVKVAYLGPPATFTHQAARERFGASVEYVPCDTISDVFSTVQKRTADVGVVPIENSTDGVVAHTQDEFVDSPLKICAEIYLPVSQNLLSAGSRDEVKRICSKAEVFGQCRRWLNQHMPGIEQVAVSSTAKAAERAAKESGTAALASRLAAELYGLRILDENVQDLSLNTTRFLVLSKEAGGSTGNDKTSIFFAVKHKVGALHEALDSFKRYGINMTKIESRPSRTKAWEYLFFVDLEGHARDAHVQKALSELAEHCLVLTVLGSYPRAAGRES